MFANFYQSKFEDFEIVTKKPFSLSPKNVVVPNQFVGLSKAVSIYKIGLYSIGFISLISIGFYFLYADSNNNNSIEKQSEIVIENKYETNTNPPITTHFDSIKSKTTSHEKVVSNKIISTKKDKNSIQNPIAKMDKKAIVAMKKDSVKTEKPKVVVIKKQFIKHDTIYVTK
jgi:hypothetical protein